MARPRMYSILTLMLLLAALPAVAGNMAAPLSTPELKQVIGSGKKSTFVFFLNPYGAPCNMQKEILMQLQKERKGNFNIAYVSALEQQNQQAFYDYGIRGLPSLVLVDKHGKIGRVFPPGIQPTDVLSAALDGMR
jgi:thiol-disulfide isomerase/thioredoxin